jgi:serine/threonine protein phosphatase PrpC
MGLCISTLICQLPFVQFSVIGLVRVMSTYALPYRIALQRWPCILCHRQCKDKQASGEVSIHKYSVCIEEFAIEEGRVVSSKFTLSSADYQALWEKHLAKGVRPSEQTKREWNVILPKVDKQRNPLDRILPTSSTSYASQPSLGSKGSAKHSFRGDRASADGVYGEDAACSECLLKNDDSSVIWLMVADGHGGCGAETAKRARELFRQAWQELSPQIVELTEKRRFDEAKKLMQSQGYSVVVNRVESEAACNGWTGSTITHMLTVTTRTGQRIVYTSNMGDSPAAVMIIGGSRAAKGAKVFVTSCSHSWDEEDEVQRYADNVWFKREAARKQGELYEHIRPSPVCYHTFNCDGCGTVLKDVFGNEPKYDRSRCQWVPGNAKPIVMWEYVERMSEEGEVDGWKVQLDDVAAAHVWRTAATVYGDYVIGGVQANATKKVLVCGEEARPFQPAAPEQNWGSCVLVGESQRGCQATRGIADTRERQMCHTSDQASFMALELYPDEEVILVVMSDGVERVVGLQELADELRGTSNREGQALANQVMTIVENRHGPTHDDCSVSVAYLAPNQQSSSRNLKARHASMISSKGCESPTLLSSIHGRPSLFCKSLARCSDVYA